MFHGFGNIMFTIVPVIIGIGFAAIFFMVIGTFVSSAKQNRRNNASPVLAVPAVMVTKRTDMRRSSAHGDGMAHTYSRYYATFQVESGDRMEFQVQDTDYGLLVEGDRGKLTFQGTRFLKFERE